MKEAIAKANEPAQEIPGGFIPSLFTNKANPKIHFATTGDRYLSTPLFAE